MTKLTGERARLSHGGRVHHLVCSTPNGKFTLCGKELTSMAVWDATVRVPVARTCEPCRKALATLRRLP